MANALQGINEEINKVPKKQRRFVYLAIAGLILFVIVKARQNAAIKATTAAQTGQVIATPSPTPLGVPNNPLPGQASSDAGIAALRSDFGSALYGLQAELQALANRTGTGAQTVGNPVYLPASNQQFTPPVYINSNSNTANPTFVNLISLSGLSSLFGGSGSGGSTTPAIPPVSVPTGGGALQPTPAVPVPATTNTSGDWAFIGGGVPGGPNVEYPSGYNPYPTALPGGSSTIPGTPGYGYTPNPTPQQPAIIGGGYSGY